MRIVLAGLLAAVLFSAGSATAQTPDPRLGLGSGPASWHASDAPGSGSLHALRLPDASREDRRHPGWLAAGAVGGGALGLVGGMVAGALIDAPGANDGCTGFCNANGIAYGALAGEALGVALGAHFANGRQGSFPAGLLTSAGILVVGVAARREVPVSVVLVPAAQIVGAIVVERATARP